MAVQKVQLLSQATGYGVIIGLSIAFGLIIIAAVKIQKRYLSEDSDHSEVFMVANRSVGLGLTASAVFSSWMWINESVFSAAYTYVRSANRMLDLNTRQMLTSFSIY